jgi:glutamine synthetase
VDAHLDACIYAGLKISGINAEVAPGQWEFQIGPAEGIEAGDHLWMARYLLERITEDFGSEVYIEYHPKPLQGINGSGCHCNYSTNEMREGREDKKGIEFIYEAIKKLEDNHDAHMKVYGADNDQRMTGLHETSSYKKFTYGKANRGCSVRIGNKTVEEGRGYFEDRRPASNCDPYLVTSKIFETTTT